MTKMEVKYNEKNEIVRFGMGLSSTSRLQFSSKNLFLNDKTSARFS